MRLFRYHLWIPLFNTVLYIENKTATGLNAEIVTFLTCFSGIKTQINWWKRMTLFMGDQLVVVLWRHANTYCDVIWPTVLRTFLSGSLASSRRRQVDYHSLIIESGSRRFHWLACKKVFSYFITIRNFDLSQNELGQGNSVIIRSGRCMATYLARL